MSRLLGPELRKVEVRLPRHLEVHSGDKVTLGLSDDALLRGAAIVYLVPLFGLLTGAALAAGLWPAAGDAGGLVGGGAGFVAGIGLAQWLARRAEHLVGFKPVILAQCGRPAK